MASDTQIVPMSLDVVEGFHHSLDAVARERRYLSMLEAPPLAETRNFIAAMIKANNPQVVALRDGGVIGWCDISRHRWPSHAHRGTLGMDVIPTHRGRGVGRRLIDDVLGRAWACGLTRVELAVHSDNAPAVALYEKVGFQREGVERCASLIDGVYRDAIKMAIVR